MGVLTHQTLPPGSATAEWEQGWNWSVKEIKSAQFLADRTQISTTF